MPTAVPEAPRATDETLDSVLHPSPSEAAAAARLRTRLRDFERSLVAKSDDQDAEELEIPASVLAALRRIVEAMARGQAVTIMPLGKELTTQEAADLLHVSRPHLVKLLDRGEMPHHRVGSHRRVRIEDVLSYRERRAAQRREHLDELTRLSQEVEGGYR